MKKRRERRCPICGCYWSSIHFIKHRGRYVCTGCLKKVREDVHSET